MVVEAWKRKEMPMNYLTGTCFGLLALLNAVRPFVQTDASQPMFLSILLAVMFAIIAAGNFIAA